VDGGIDSLHRRRCLAKQGKRQVRNQICWKIRLTVRSQRRLHVKFIQAVDIQTVSSNENLQIMPEQRSIYMILQECITIMTVPMASSDPLFLDIPFDKISKVEIQTNTMVASQESSASEKVVQLLLTMRTGLWNYHLCAHEAEAKAMLLTFSNMDQAKQVAVFIEEECAQDRNSGVKMSISQPLNISQEVEKGSPQIRSEEGHEDVSPRVIEMDDQLALAKELIGNTSRSSGVEGAGVMNLRHGRDPSNSNDVEDIVERKAEQKEINAAEAGAKKKGGSAGNLSILLSGALSPEPDEPAFIQVQEPGKRTQRVSKTTGRATVAPKQKATSSAKSRKAKQREPEIKNEKGGFRVTKRSSVLASDQPEKRFEDAGIWDIPDDPAESKTAVYEKSKAKTTTAKKVRQNASAKTPKTVTSKKWPRTAERKPETDSDDDKQDGTFKISRGPQLSSSSPRRSARLQASAMKQKVVPIENPANHGDNDTSGALRKPFTPTRRSPRLQSLDSQRKPSKEEQVSKPTEVQKSNRDNPQKSSLNKHKPRQAKGSRNQRREQVPATSHAGDVTPTPNQFSMNDIEETIETFEASVMDFQGEPVLHDSQLKIKREPRRKPKTPEVKKATREGASPRSPIVIASDVESGEDSEEDVKAHSQRGASPQPENPTASTEDTQNDIKAMNRAKIAEPCKDISVIRQLHALDKENSTTPSPLDHTPIEQGSAGEKFMTGLDRSGPYNQGLRLSFLAVNEAPIIHSDPVQTRDMPKELGRSHGVTGFSLHTRPEFRQPGRVQEGKVGETRRSKRPSPDDVLRGQPMKRQRISQPVPGNNGFFDIESCSETAGKASRQASQRSVHITAEGSPIRIGFLNGELAPTAAEFSEINDNYLQEVFGDEAGRLMARAVSVPEAASSLKTLSSPNVHKTQHHSSKPVNMSESNPSSWRQSSEWPKILNQNQTAGDSEGNEFSGNGPLSMMNSAQAEGSSGDAEGDVTPMSKKARLRQQIETSGIYQAGFHAGRHRSSSGRAQRSTAALSSNHKPLPQPPQWDSRVISAYAPERVIQEAVARNRAEEMANDPFSNRQTHGEVEETSFMRRLATLINDQHRNADCGYAGEDVDKTLVVDVAMENSDSLSSSNEELTVVEEEPEEEEYGNADEMEWEAALHPRHRDMFEVLGRITRRLVSHLIESESAVDDVVNDYNRDGTWIVGELEKCYREHRKSAGGFQALVTKLRKLYAYTEHKTGQDQKDRQKQIDSALQNWKAGLKERKNVIAQMELLSSA
jgi:hypothetical protein